MKWTKGAFHTNARSAKTARPAYARSVYRHTAPDVLNGKLHARFTVLDPCDPYDRWTLEHSGDEETARILAQCDAENAAAGHTIPRPDTKRASNMRRFPTIKLDPAPVHVVQYRDSPHAYGAIFTTRATTTAGIARAAARAAREDCAYWSGNYRRAPVITCIDYVALQPRDWEDPEMQRFTDLIDTEASKARPPKRHESAERATWYTLNFLG